MTIKAVTDDAYNGENEPCNTVEEDDNENNGRVKE